MNEAKIKFKSRSARVTFWIIATLVGVDSFIDVFSYLLRKFHRDIELLIKMFD